MFESFLITFRETLEAGLVVFIILSYLKKVHQSRHTRVVYSGVVAAVAISAVAAFLFAMRVHHLSLRMFFRVSSLLLIFSYRSLAVQKEETGFKKF